MKATILCGFYVCENIHSITIERGRVLEQFRVRKQYSHFYFITIKCAEFHSYILTPLFKLDRTDAGWSPTKASPASNLRGIGGIHTWRGLIKKRRILSLQKMKRFILDCIYAWMCTICSSVKYYNLCCSMRMFMTMLCMKEVILHDDVL